MTDKKIDSSIFTIVVALAGVLGFILGYLMSRSKDSTALTTFTRDEQGRILEIMERME